MVPGTFWFRGSYVGEAREGRPCCSSCAAYPLNLTATVPSEAERSSLRDNGSPEPSGSGDHLLVVSEGGLEPPRPFNKALAPQASASTYSATRTCVVFSAFQRLGRDLAPATQRNLAWRPPRPPSHVQVLPITLRCSRRSRSPAWTSSPRARWWVRALAPPHFRRTPWQGTRR